MRPLPPPRKPAFPPRVVHRPIRGPALAAAHCRGCAHSCSDEVLQSFLRTILCLTDVLIIIMAPTPFRKSVPKDRFPSAFATLKPQTYNDPSTRGPGSHTYVSPTSPDSKVNVSPLISAAVSVPLPGTLLVTSLQQGPPTEP